MVDKNEVVNMKQNFDKLKHTDENGKEYWYAHELSKAMGYSEYRNFKPAIDRAASQMKSVGKNPDDHLVQVHEMISTGKGAERQIDGYKLDKLGSYTVAMNADPSKTEVAFAQEYFLQSTAKAEVLQQRMSDKNYIENRNALKDSNSKLVSTLVSHDVPENKISTVLDAGDQGFFGMHTREVKEMVGISKNKPVADIMGEDLTAFKKVAQIMSRGEIEYYNARGVEQTTDIVKENNEIMRNHIIEKLHTTPEEMIPFEDVKKVERRYDKATEKLLDKLKGDI